MTYKSQLSRDAASVGTSASKQNQWLRFVAVMLARAEEALAAFSEFMFPEFFESSARHGGRQDIARFQTRGPDAVIRSDREIVNGIDSHRSEQGAGGKRLHIFQHPGLDLPKAASRSQAAWNRARARRRRMR
jgi:hypothetical protein